MNTLRDPHFEAAIDPIAEALAASIATISLLPSWLWWPARRQAPPARGGLRPASVAP